MIATRLAHPLRAGRQQHRFVDRLGRIIIATRLDTLGPILCHRMRGECDNRQLTASLDEVLNEHFQSSLVVSSNVDVAPPPNETHNIASLVSAMANFDPKTAGDTQIGGAQEENQSVALAAWVA